MSGTTRLQATLTALAVAVLAGAAHDPVGKDKGKDKKAKGPATGAEWRLFRGDPARTAVADGTRHWRRGVGL